MNRLMQCWLTASTACHCCLPRDSYDAYASATPTTLAEITERSSGGFEEKDARKIMHGIIGVPLPGHQLPAGHRMGVAIEVVRTLENFEDFARYVQPGVSDIELLDSWIINTRPLNRAWRNSLDGYVETLAPTPEGLDEYCMQNRMSAGWWTMLTADRFRPRVRA